MQRSLFTLLTQTALIFFAANAIAAEAPRWYEVELVLIGYEDSQKIDDENWPAQLSSFQSSYLDTPTEAAEAKPELDDNQPIETTAAPLTDSNITADPWAWISWWNNRKEANSVFDIQKGGADSNQSPIDMPFADQGVPFDGQLERFEKAANLTVIWNKKWRQPIPEQADALADENLVIIDIQTAFNSDTLADSDLPLVEVELGGHLHLYRSRYLHLVSNLAVQHWKNEEVIIDPAAEAGSEDSNSDDLLPAPESVFEQEPALLMPAETETIIQRVPLRSALIQQSRRMRSTELHYIDHPMVGILVRVTPIEE